MYVGDGNQHRGSLRPDTESFPKTPGVLAGQAIKHGIKCLELFCQRLPAFGQEAQCGRRILRDHQIEVLEVNRPDRATRRLRGKSDPTVAENAARAVLSGSATAIPKAQSGAAEAMRAVSVARRSAVKANTQAINQLRALLVSAPQDIRERLWKGKPAECVDGCTRLRSLGNTPLLQTLLEKEVLQHRGRMRKLMATLGCWEDPPVPI